MRSTRLRLRELTCLHLRSRNLGYKNSNFNHISQLALLMPSLY